MLKKVNYRADHLARSTLLFLVGLTALIFTLKTAPQIHSFYAYSSSVPAQIISWHPTRLSADRYILEVDYSYSVGDVVHESTGRLKYNFLNEYAALDASARLTDLTVHYDPRHPGRCCLEKCFPIKSSLYLALVLAVLTYFAYLHLAYPVRPLTG